MPPGRDNFRRNRVAPYCYFSIFRRGYSAREDNENGFASVNVSGVSAAISICLLPVNAPPTRPPAAPTSAPIPAPLPPPAKPPINAPPAAPPPVVTAVRFPLPLIVLSREPTASG